VHSLNEPLPSWLHRRHLISHSDTGSIDGSDYCGYHGVRDASHSVVAVVAEPESRLCKGSSIISSDFASEDRERHRFETLVIKTFNIVDSIQKNCHIYRNIWCSHIVYACNLCAFNHMCISCVCVHVRARVRVWGMRAHALMSARSTVGASFHAHTCRKEIRWCR
jgi:hypothetical protein